MNRLGNRKPRKIQRGRGASRSQPSRPIPLRAIEQGVLILLLISIATWGTEWLTDPQNLPLREVSIEGQFQHTTKQKIRETVTSHITGGFFQRRPRENTNSSRGITLDISGKGAPYLAGWIAGSG